MSGAPLDLDEIETRANAATPGPWRWGPGSWDDRDGEPNGEDDKLYGPETVVHSDGSARGEYGPDIDVRGADAEFIAHAREDVPALVAEVRRLREVEKAAREMLDEFTTGARMNYFGSPMCEPVVRQETVDRWRTALEGETLR